MRKSEPGFAVRLARPQSIVLQITRGGEDARRFFLRRLN
jgi:hypothetical protein